jgi:hypothetical protein
MLDQLPHGGRESWVRGVCGLQGIEPAVEALFGLGYVLRNLRETFPPQAATCGTFGS